MVRGGLHPNRVVVQNGGGATRAEWWSVIAKQLSDEHDDMIAPSRVA